MVKSIEGVFRDGKVELLEPPPQTEESRVSSRSSPLARRLT